MTIRTRIAALEAKQGHEEVLFAIPSRWPHDPPPTEAEIEAHHVALRAALQNPKAIIIHRPAEDGSDPWRVQPIMDADRGKQITIRRSYGVNPAI